MSRLRAITARFGMGRKGDSEEPDTQAEVAAAASTTAYEQSGSGADRGDVDNPATSDAPSLAEFEAQGAALREGGQPTAPDAAPAPEASPGPPGER
jgi:hypothetical protein